jgi:hypothetical protein
VHITLTGIIRAPNNPIAFFGGPYITDEIADPNLSEPILSQMGKEIIR